MHSLSNLANISLIKKANCTFSIRDCSYILPQIENLSNPNNFCLGGIVSRGMEVSQYA